MPAIVASSIGESLLASEVAPAVVESTMLPTAMTMAGAGSTLGTISALNGLGGAMAADPCPAPGNCLQDIPCAAGGGLVGSLALCRLAPLFRDRRLDRLFRPIRLSLVPELARHHRHRYASGRGADRRHYRPAPGHPGDPQLHRHDGCPPRTAARASRALRTEGREAPHPRLELPARQAHRRGRRGFRSDRRDVRGEAGRTGRRRADGRRAPASLHARPH